MNAIVIGTETDTRIDTNKEEDTTIIMIIDGQTADGEATIKHFLYINKSKHQHCYKGSKNLNKNLRKRVLVHSLEFYKFKNISPD